MLHLPIKGWIDWLLFDIQHSSAFTMPYFLRRLCQHSMFGWCSSPMKAIRQIKLTLGFCALFYVDGHATNSTTLFIVRLWLVHFIFVAIISLDSTSKSDGASKFIHTPYAFDQSLFLRFNKMSFNDHIEHNFSIYIIIFSHFFKYFIVSAVSTHQE